MKRLVLILPLFAAHLSVFRAEPFEQAEVKKAINVVSLLSQSRTNRAMASEKKSKFQR
jgi:hypothetical protein